MLFGNINNTMLFSVISVFYMIFFAVGFFAKKKVDSTELKIFKGLIIANLISLVVEILLVVLIITNSSLLNIMLKIFNICIFSYVWIFGLYSYLISKRRSKINSKSSLFILYLIFYLICSIGMLILPVYLNFEDFKQYSFGPSVYLLFIAIGIVVTVTFFILILNIKNIKKIKCTPIIMFIMFIGINAIIQFIWPHILLANSFFSFITFMMYHTIENPDLKLLREIQESRELAEQSNKEKAMFLYDLAQDIKLPIKNISNKCDELMNIEDLNVIKEVLRDIKFSTKKLSSSVDGILDTSTIKHANIEVAHNKYNIKNLLQEVSIKAKSDLKDKSIEFRSDFDVNIPEYLYGDSIRLKQILTIIIENAIKHTDKGFIEFNTSSIIKNDICRLMINIEDSGKGIESRKLETLFYLSEEDLEDQEKMNRLASTKENLSVIKLLTTLIGGTVIVNSTLGKGTKFTIVLDQEIHENEKSSTIEAIDTLKTRKRVLLVNNLDIDIKALSKILEKYDVSFDVVKWGQECLEKIRRKEKYDYILLDEEMPKLNGIKTFEKLKLENNFNIPVILLVEEHHAEHKDRYLNNGFTDVIAKPYKKVTVTKVLDKYLK